VDRRQTSDPYAAEGLRELIFVGRHGQGIELQSLDICSGENISSFGNELAGTFI
jgi:hypothetical protein